MPANLQEANAKTWASHNVLNNARKKLDRAFEAETKAQQLVDELKSKLSEAESVMEVASERLDLRRQQVSGVGNGV